jgi:penicillin-binding protein 1C
VLCVWIGNFDGKPMPGLFARETAAPLLFETAVRLRLSGKPSAPPANVVSANLCSVSGMVAAPCCPHVRQSALIAGVSPIAVCDVHREVYLNAHGERVHAGHRDANLAVREFWPQDRLDQFRRAGLPRLEPPAWAAGEEGASDSKPPHIVSPQAALTYVLRPAKPEHRVIPLEARAAPGVRRIHWFAGPQYVGSSPPGQAFLWEAPPGRWTIKAADDSGYSAQVTITVTSVL